MKLSASKVSLLTKCKYPFRSDVAIGPGAPRNPSVESRCGSALHLAAEWYLATVRDDLLHAAEHFGVVRELPQMVRKWDHMRRWIDETSLTRMFVPEVKFALDLTRGTGRQLQETGPRDYSGVREGEIPMTIDRLSVDLTPEAGVPRLDDWKTGHSAEGYWAQIATMALAVSYWLQSEHPQVWEKHKAVEGGILHVTPEGIYPHVHTFDQYELVAIAMDLAGDVAAIEGSSPTKGDHCLELYCEAFRSCPETKNAVDGVRDLVPASALVRPGDFALSPTIRSADHAAWCKAQLRTYNRYAEEVEDAIEAFVGDGEHPLTDGGVLKKTYREPVRTSIPELIALALSKGATEAEVQACSHKSRESNGIRVVGAKPRRVA